MFAASAPVAVGAVAAIWLSHWLPTTSTLAGTIFRVLLIVAGSTAAVFVVDRGARRLLPLAAIYRLSLVFPDHAPSRFRTALKAGSSKRVERLVAETRLHGLPSDAGDAARRVVELITAVGDHDRRTRGHSERVRLYADLIGEELRLSKQERQKLQWAALLHDLGKLTVPGDILNKKGAPTSDEWHILRTHPAAGERLVLPLREFLGTWADAIGGHHEWWNGTGYPRQLKGDQISRSAAIVAVADAYEVMTAVRSYKKSLPASTARAELAHGAGVQFSPEVVRAFLCVSLGKLRWVAGPAASLAQIPFIGSAVRFPTTVSTAVQGGGNIAAAAGPSVAAFMVATTAVATTMVAAPTPHHTQKAKTYAFAEAASHKTVNTAAPTTTTKIAGITKALKTTTTSTTVGKPAASSDDETTDSDASEKPDDETSDDVAAVDPETPTTDPVEPEPVVVTPVISIGDVSTPEGDNGTRVMSFPVTLSEPANAPVTVQFSVTSGTAIVGASTNAGTNANSAPVSEVKVRSGKLTFEPTDTGLTPITKKIAVTMRSDTDVEPDETFSVTLSDPTGATLKRSVATGTILNDDGITLCVSVGVGDASIANPGIRATSVAIPVWLSAPSADTVLVGYEISDGTAKWSEKAKGGGDYGGETSGVLEFAPGTVMLNIPVKLWPHTDSRPDRAFTITLTSADGGGTVIVRHLGTFTIYGT